MSTLRIRMYNVGFGDSFLVTLPDARKVLVDCGFHSQGRGPMSAKELVRQIVEDVTPPGGTPRIDVVIATHRHQDHVYAFNASEWDEVEVGEVWTNWLENRKDPEATRLWRKKDAFTLALSKALPQFHLDPADQREVEFLLWNAGLGAPEQLGFEAWSNGGALDRLRDGFLRRDRPEPRYLPKTTALPEALESPALPGVRVHVLGPARDPELIDELDPERDGETYRALSVLASDAGAGALPGPFGPAWRCDAPATELEPDELEYLHYVARTSDALFAAQAVDGMINSTSLVLVLEVGKARLLLPGDAEWGTWKRILASEECCALLRSSTFVKVGHHGSHNATPKTLVEEILRPGTRGMISTQQGEGRYRKGIPLDELLTAFTRRELTIVRSDTPPAGLPQGFELGPGSRWIDLELAC